MYNGTLVLDVHGHVSVPPAATNFLVTLVGTNSPQASTIGKPAGAKGAVPIDDFRAAAAKHVAYIDERCIDVQVLGPRPYLQMGWMEPHLNESWARLREPHHAGAARGLVEPAVRPVRGA